MEQEPLQFFEMGVREARELGHASRRVSQATLQLTALFWVLLESGEHVVGQWCNWIKMKNWDLCAGCAARWRQNWKASGPSRGRS